MNILQIHGVPCPSAESNRASGVLRMVTQLSDYYQNHYSDRLFMAYFRDAGLSPAPCFSDSLLLAGNGGGGWQNWANL